MSEAVESEMFVGAVGSADEFVLERISLNLSSGFGAVSLEAVDSSSSKSSFMSTTLSTSGVANPTLDFWVVWGGR